MRPSGEPAPGVPPFGREPSLEPGVRSHGPGAARGCGGAAPVSPAAELGHPQEARAVSGRPGGGLQERSWRDTGEHPGQVGVLAPHTESISAGPGLLDAMAEGLCMPTRGEWGTRTRGSTRPARARARGRGQPWTRVPAHSVLRGRFSGTPPHPPPPGEGKVPPGRPGGDSSGQEGPRGHRR